MTPPLRPVIACHCETCRKTSGHFWAATAVPFERFTLTNDAGLGWYTSSDVARRGFCKSCGSSLFYERKDQMRMAISAGAIEGETGLDLISHVFTAEKGDYYALPNDVPCHAGFSGDENA
jgi:hypothetical protein